MSPSQRNWVSKAELTKYGIATIAVEVFEWGGYRYSNAHDAVAAARRASSQ